MADNAMTKLNRRNAMILAAGGVAAGSISGGAAMAQDSGNGSASSSSDPKTAIPGWHRVRLGDATITMILDGLREGEGPFPTFGHDQSQEAMAALMRENRLPEKRFVNGFTPVLLQFGDDLILIDTGMGEGGRSKDLGHLVERMGKAGYQPEDVTIVALTHFHGDHIQGLMTGGSATFPRARYVAGRKEYDWWTSDEAKNGDRAGNAKLVEQLVVPLKDKMTFLKDGDPIVPGLVAHDAFGHTPGHMIFELESNGRKLIFAGDVSNHFVASLQKPEWEVSFDQDTPTATETRKRVFDRIAEERLPFIGYHMPFPAIGYVEKLEDGGFRFIPETYQLDVPQDA